MIVQSRISELQDELKSLYVTPGVRQIIQSPEQAATPVLYEMSALDQEELWTGLVNTRNALVGIHRVYRGSLNTATVRAGEIFRLAILENAASIIVYHNHPSGDPTPSVEDIALTRALVQAGKLLDIEMLDHIVVSGGQFVSMKERGLGF